MTNYNKNYNHNQRHWDPPPMGEGIIFRTPDDMDGKSMTIAWPPPPVISFAVTGVVPAGRYRLDHTDEAARTAYYELESAR